LLVNLACVVLNMQKNKIQEKKKNLKQQVNDIIKKC
jgi:hypothetical protein